MMAPTAQNNFHISEENLKKVVEDFFLILSDKERAVVTKRFSLDNKPRQTLEKIGEHFSVTRERIRQIEEIALKKLKRNLSTSQLRNVSQVAKKILLAHGGVMGERDLVSATLKEIQSDTSFSGNVAQLALTIEGTLTRVKKPKEFHTFWYMAEHKLSYIRLISKALEKTLKKEKKILSEETLFRKCADVMTTSVTEETIRSVLTISPKLIAPTANVWGLSSWRDINPKSIRDRACLVLEKAKKTLHFIEIANQIGESTRDKKMVTVQAVHNELIRYSDFVLVGRGLYALSKWGMVPGTVMDVIAIVLKKNGAMKKQDIIDEVKKVREVKEATIVLNLQKCPAFVRVGRAVYDFDPQGWVTPKGGRGRAYLNEDEEEEV
ncbi:MAG: sigma factor-like helix-turn-helix DNA-binding protein [Candidatus Peregrinibacteria bacterium]